MTQLYNRGVENFIKTPTALLRMSAGLDENNSNGGLIFDFSELTQLGEEQERSLFSPVVHFRGQSYKIPQDWLSTQHWDPKVNEHSDNDMYFQTKEEARLAIVCYLLMCRQSREEEDFPFKAQRLFAACFHSADWISLGGVFGDKDTSGDNYIVLKTHSKCTKGDFAVLRWTNGSGSKGKDVIEFNISRIHSAEVQADPVDTILYATSLTVKR